MYEWRHEIFSKDMQAQFYNLNSSHSPLHHPLTVLSFSYLHVCAVSLPSKKGLRYLLYPFISFWMVGGRISPSFTSALSSEFSNNLRTKTETEKGWNKRQLSLLLLSAGGFFFDESVGCRLSSTARLKGLLRCRLKWHHWNWGHAKNKK